MYVAVRSKGLIVLNISSSKIASILLLGGRTPHSILTIPIEIMNLLMLANKKLSKNFNHEKG